MLTKIVLKTAILEDGGCFSHTNLSAYKFDSIVQAVICFDSSHRTARFCCVEAAKKSEGRKANAFGRAATQIQAL